MIKGLLAGLVGAAAMALWFLVIDGSRGTPLRTPAFLAHALLDLDQVQMTLGPIVLYTLVHLAAWSLVGIFVAWILSVLKVSSPVLLGLVLGFALFDIVFYSSVIVTGVDVIAELGWAEVLVGNLIAGVSLLGFLHAVGATVPVAWWATMAESRIVKEGFVAGLIGAGAVAAWFLIFDLARGEPFFTPGALGSALFLGADSLSAVRVETATVLGYTLLHLLAFGITGLLAAAIVAAAEEIPALILGAVLFFAVFEAFFMATLAMVAEFLLGPLAWGTIALGNLLAATSMGWYLWRSHPKLRAALAADPFDRAR